MDGDEAAKAETRATMRWVLDQCLILLHPIMPFLTEALWQQHGPRAKLLAHADWPAYGADLVDPAADAEMRWTIALIDEVRSVRAQMNVPAGLHVPLVRLDSDAAARAAWDRNAVLIQRLARIDSLGRMRPPPRKARSPWHSPAPPSRCPWPTSSTSPPNAPACTRRWTKLAKEIAKGLRDTRNAGREGSRGIPPRHRAGPPGRGRLMLPASICPQISQGGAGGQRPPAGSAPEALR
jgi:valyl-tRNA synthetase